MFVCTLRNDNRTRRATYQNTIRGWIDPSNINSATYVMQHFLEIQLPARRRFAKLRSSGHDLRVEVERHQAVHPPREARVCRLCSAGTVEDEHHMIFDCTHQPLVAVREQYPTLLERIFEQYHRWSLDTESTSSSSIYF